MRFPMPRRAVERIASTTLVRDRGDTVATITNDMKDMRSAATEVRLAEPPPPPPPPPLPLYPQRQPPPISAEERIHHIGLILKRTHKKDVRRLRMVRAFQEIEGILAEKHPQAKYPDQSAVRAALVIVLLHCMNFPRFGEFITKYYDFGEKGTVDGAKRDLYVRMLLLRYNAATVYVSRYDTLLRSIKQIHSTYPYLKTRQAEDELHRTELTIANKLSDLHRAEHAYMLLKQRRSFDTVLVLGAANTFAAAAERYEIVVGDAQHYTPHERIRHYRTLLSCAKKEGPEVDHISVEGRILKIMSRNADPPSSVSVLLIALCRQAGDLKRADVLIAKALEAAKEAGMTTALAQGMMEVFVARLDVLRSERHAKDAREVVSVVAAARRLYQSVAMLGADRAAEENLHVQPASLQLSLAMVVSYTGILARVGGGREALQVYNVARSHGFRDDIRVARNVVTAIREEGGMIPPELLNRVKH